MPVCCAKQNLSLKQGELNLEEGEKFHDRPPLDIVIKKFRAAKITAYIAGKRKKINTVVGNQMQQQPPCQFAGLFFTALFVCIWPGSMLSVGVLDWKGFNAWTIISRVWAVIAATFIIVVPLVQEVMIGI